MPFWLDRSRTFSLLWGIDCRGEGPGWFGNWRVQKFVSCLLVLSELLMHLFLAPKLQSIYCFFFFRKSLSLDVWRHILKIRGKEFSWPHLPMLNFDFTFDKLFDVLKGRSFLWILLEKMSKHMGNIWRISFFYTFDQILKILLCRFAVDEGQICSLQKAESEKIDVWLIKINFRSRISDFWRMDAQSRNTHGGQVVCARIHESNRSINEYFAWAENPIQTSFAL